MSGEGTENRAEMRTKTEEKLRSTASFMLKKASAAFDAVSLAKYLEEGGRYLEKSEYLRALAAFYKAVRIDSMNCNAYLGIAGACQGMGDYLTALQILKQGWHHTGNRKLLNAARALDYVIDWEDAALERLIREYLGKTEGDIYWSEVRGIKELEINGIYIVRRDEKESSCGVVSHSEDLELTYYFRTDKRSINSSRDRGTITTLGDMRHFNSLEKLTVFYNSIKDISGLGKLTKLRYLLLGYNHISNINVLVRLTELSTVILYGNRISNIRALGKLFHVNVLELYDNQIDDIGALAGLTNLTRLYLHDNRIKDVSPLAGLTNLEILFLYDNRICDVTALAGLKSLQHLFLWGNRIRDYSPVAFVPNLLREWN